MFRSKEQDQIYDIIVNSYPRNLHEKLYKAMIDADYTVINAASQTLNKKYRHSGKQIDLEE
jgi:hypothetical protein